MIHHEPANHPEFALHGRSRRRMVSAPADAVHLDFAWSIADRFAIMRTIEYAPDTTGNRQTHDRHGGGTVAQAPGAWPASELPRSARADYSGASRRGPRW